ncbi:MAG: hypothetical protein IPJ75_01685 [Ignavibacteriales bacterium]|nr:hypothetical protein [Ignavibacteriales bacterium]
MTPKPEIIYIQLRNLKSDYVKKHIASPQEVEEYLSSLREKMLNEIRNGKRIIPG